MNLAPLWIEAAPIPLHALVAIGALGLGIVQMLALKST